MALQVIPSFFQFIMAIISIMGIPGSGMFVFILMPLLLFTIYLLLFLLLIFKSEWLVDRLKLDRGFNEHLIDIRFDFVKLTGVVIICLGGWLLIDAIPAFFQGIFSSASSVTVPGASVQQTGLLLPIIKIAMGVILMAFYPAISKLIVSRNNKEGL